jgi:hypothetical protein
MEVILMNMKKKVMLIFNLIIFVLNILVVPIYATSKANLEFTITANKEEVYGGDEVEITLRLEDYENVEKGLNAYTATIDYDENIFEKISASNFVSLNNWESLEYNPENKSFVAIKKAGTSEAEDVVTIKLKVKENVTGQDTEIKFKNFATSKGKYDIEKPEEKKIIHIIEESSKLPDNDSSNDNQKPDDNKNNDNNTVGSTDGTNNNTVNNSADKTNNNTVANSTDKTNNNIVANSTDKTNNNTVANSTDKTNNTVANKTDGNNSSNNTVVGSTDETTTVQQEPQADQIMAVQQEPQADQIMAVQQEK